MGWLIKLLIVDDFTCLVIFNMFKIGMIHPENTPGVVKGLMIGIWRFEIQIVFGFWDKLKQYGEMGNA